MWKTAPKKSLSVVRHIPDTDLWYLRIFQHLYGTAALYMWLKPARALPRQRHLMLRRNPKSSAKHKTNYFVKLVQIPTFLLRQRHYLAGQCERIPSSAPSRFHRNSLGWHGTSHGKTMSQLLIRHFNALNAVSPGRLLRYQCIIGTTVWRGSDSGTPRPTHTGPSTAGSVDTLPVDTHTTPIW